MLQFDFSDTGRITSVGFISVLSLNILNFLVLKIKTTNVEVSRSSAHSKALSCDSNTYMCLEEKV